MVSAVAVQSNQRKALLIDHIDIHSKTSIIHLGSIDTFDITEAGKQASKFLLDALNNNNLEAATAASTVYDRIIPKENYGGEYTALQWFAWYLLAPLINNNKCCPISIIENFLTFGQKMTLPT
ncbi:hypothetical protein D3800_00050 [Microcystis aeruginosa NIES-298]|uniref:hypothetical protein n=1 Tax=Microcystis aeruginosa TaxID=1126 RepID=UPI00138C1043|nr:hypothetical protein [Microcystis aeruginosa]QHU81888.1 hypothetical protein D3800_00050 [Microcystis aeruginosa NIES-298]